MPQSGWLLLGVEVLVQALVRYLVLVVVVVVVEGLGLALLVESLFDPAACLAERGWVMEPAPGLGTGTSPAERV